MKLILGIAAVLFGLVAIYAFLKKPNWSDKDKIEELGTFKGMTGASLFILGGVIAIWFSVGISDGDLKQANNSSTKASCKVTNTNGQLVKFYNTVMPHNAVWNEKLLCEAANEMVVKGYEQGKEGMLFFCNMADDYAREFGHGDYDEAIQMISAMKRTTQTQSVLKTLNYCRTNESKETLIKESVPTRNIYSVGEFDLEGGKCLGYIMEMVPLSVPSPQYDSQIYILEGTGSCIEFSSDKLSDRMFHPEDRPNAPAPGKYIRDNFKYTGAMPKSFIYKGIEYQFY